MKMLCQISLFIALTLYSLTIYATQTDPQAYFDRGQFERAAQAWAAELSDKALKNDPIRYINTSLRLSSAYLSLGRIINAFKVLESALPVAKKDNDLVRHATVLMYLSDVYLAMRDFKDEDMDSLMGICTQKTLTETNIINEAIECLNQAKSMAPNVPLLSANLLNKRGNILMAQGKYAEAWLRYEDSIESADEAGDKILSAKAAINRIQAMVKDGNNVVVKEIFDKAYQKVESLPDSHDKAFALISLVQLLPLLQAPPEMQFTLSTKEQRLRANNMLTQAIEIAELLKDNRAIAYAKSYMAQLYAQEDRYPEAVQLIREAIHYAHNPNTVTVKAVQNVTSKAVQNVISNEHCTPNTQHQNCLIETGFRSYPELLYSLEWQLGKLLKQASEYQKTAKMYKEVAFEQAQRQVIIDSYQRAKTYLRSVREQYRCGGESQPFLAEAEKFSFELTELLLRQAAQAPVAQKQALLKQAIDSIEFLKETELQNYFHDVCVTKVKDKLKWEKKYVPHDTAIVYPVILDDRLELLVTFHDDTIKQFEVNVSGEKLKSTANDFWVQLKEQKPNYLKSANQLYYWLIEPMTADLDKKGIETLVIVPDKDLYRVPFAALCDRCINKKQSTRKGNGQYLIEQYALAISPAWELTDMRVIPHDNSALLMGLIEPQDKLKDSLKNNLDLDLGPLKHVTIELNNVENRLKNNGYYRKRLENESFTTDEVANRLKTLPYSIVHFSTHGHFATEPEKSFLVAFNDLLRLDDLEGSFQNLVFKKNPVDLLTLSACESGLGGEQGIAGIAIKAGTRSAVATLWQVNGKSTSDLMAKFYYHLIEKKVSKAQALQEAQKYLLKDDFSNHPYYWAPFLLIGNWK